MSCPSPKPPATDTPIDTPINAPTEATAAASARILLAEDDPGTTQVLRLQMQLVGLECDFASDGAAALALYREARAEGRPYSLLALDVAMPTLSGFAVAEAVRAGGDAQTPILFVTADDSTFSRARAKMVGAAVYLVKPKAVIDLPERIRQVLAA